MSQKGIPKIKDQHEEKLHLAITRLDELLRQEVNRSRIIQTHLEQLKSKEKGN